MSIDTETKAAPVKKLTVTDQRNLQKVVKNDFDRLTSEVHLHFQTKSAELDQRIRDHQALAQAASTVERASGYETKINAALAKAQAEMERITKDAQKAGFEVRLGVNGRHVPEGTPLSSNVALTAVVPQAMLDERTELAKQKQAALDIIHRQRLESERQVLLAAITNTAAIEFLDTIPSAKELFALAAADVKAISAE